MQCKDQSVVLNLVSHIKKEQIMKAFYFNWLTLNYDCHKGFLRPSDKEISIST